MVINLDRLGGGYSEMNVVEIIILYFFHSQRRARPKTQVHVFRKLQYTMSAYVLPVEFNRINILKKLTPHKILPSNF